MSQRLEENFSFTFLEEIDFEPKQNFGFGRF